MDVHLLQAIGTGKCNHSEQKHSISCFRISDDNTVTAVQEQRGGKGTMDESNVETLKVVVVYF